jgi:type II secretory pathway pseudopilin PulG
MNTKHNGRTKAFTLIEVLASMAVLMIIVLILGRVFQDSTNIWTLGTRRAQDNMTARAVMDFVARDVSEAVCGTNLAFRLDSEDCRVFGPAPNTGDDWEWWNDSIYFVSLGADPDSAYPRAAQLTRYYVSEMTDISNKTMRGRYRLMRGINRVDARFAYRFGPWWDTGATSNSVGWKSEAIAEDIASFEVWCIGYTNNVNGLCSYSNVPNYDSTLPGKPFQSGKLPAYIEIYLSMMDEPAAVRAAELYKAGQYRQAKKYVESVERRYAVRVHFANRDGYTGRR